MLNSRFRKPLGISVKGLISISRIFVLACCVLAACSALFAQGTADIVGTVTDNSGAVVANAKVTVKNAATSLTRNQQTDASGGYAFALLPIGDYSLTVEVQGFKTFSAQKVTLATGDRTRVDAQMQVGELTQTVEVSEQTIAMQTDSAVVGGLVNTRAVQDLPLNGRNFVALATTVAGANQGPQSSLSGGTRPDDRRQTSTVSANGQSAEANNYLLDGMDNNERSIATIIVKPSVDALQEMKIQTNLYSAEVGRASGAVVNMITKSGTNAFHGTVFEFLRNDVLDAKSYYVGANKKPPYRQNQFGGSLGGPIKKDKTFFFGDYEGLRISQSETRNLIVPTPCQLGRATCNGITQLGNFSESSGTLVDPVSKVALANNVLPASSIDKMGALYAALYPTTTNGCVTNTATPSCQFVNSPKRLQFAHTGDVRIDHRFSDNDSLYGRYSVNQTTTSTQSFLPGVNVGGLTDVQPSGSGNTFFPGVADQRQQSLGLSYVHIFTPALLLQLNGQLARYVSSSDAANLGVNVNSAWSSFLGLGNLNQNTPYAGGDGLLQVAPTGYQAVGDAFALPTRYWDTNYLYGGTVTWSLGSHALKFGATLIRRDYSQYQLLNKGPYTFNGSMTGNGNGFADLLSGYASAFGRNMAPFAPQYRTTEAGEFIQDDWRAARWLTVNMGVRYDIFTALKEKNNALSNFDPTDPAVLATGKMMLAGKDGVSDTLNLKTPMNNFQPRIGFAATLGHGTVIRGGFGTTIYATNVASPANLKNQPNTILYSPNITNGVASFRVSDALPTPTFMPACLTNACGGPSFGFTVPSATKLDYRFPLILQYNLTIEKQLGANVVSIGYVGQNAHHLGRVVPNIQAALPPLGTGGCGVSNNLSALNVCRQYTSLNNVTGIQQLRSDGNSTYNALQFVFQRRLTNGLTASANYTYASSMSDVGGAGGACGTCATVLNNFKRDRGPSDFLVRNRFALTANYSLPYGKSLKGIAGVLAKDWSFNALYVYSTGVPGTVSLGSPRFGIGSGTDRPDAGASTNSNFTQTLDQWFDISQYRAQPQGTAGNLGRNTIITPASYSLAASVFKNFAIREGMNLQFRVESFNLTNSPTFAAPGLAVGGFNSAGTPTTASNFGKITANNAFYTPRDIQLALKLIF
ncbi:MAG: carboxypeptidase regulatory-like domain-containing protein [Bryobacteraceae bacterium]